MRAIAGAVADVVRAVDAIARAGPGVVGVDAAADRIAAVRRARVPVAAGVRTERADVEASARGAGTAGVHRDAPHDRVRRRVEDPLDAAVAAVARVKVRARARGV